MHKSSRDENRVQKAKEQNKKANHRVVFLFLVRVLQKFGRGQVGACNQVVDIFGKIWYDTKINILLKVCKKFFLQKGDLVCQKTQTNK